MCRAIWVLAIAPNDEACRRLRAYAGVEAQVVAAVTDLASVNERLADTRFDAVVVDGRTPEALAIITLLAGQRPEAAIVWVGESAPAGTHVTVSPERVSDDLSRAVVRAVARRDA